MKVQVMVTNSSKAAAASTTIDASLGPADTVLNVQDFVASVTNTFSFPDQKLIFNGKVLPPNSRLSDHDVKEDDVLEFVFTASEQTFVKQLSDLLGKQAVSPEELGFLYSYKYSVSCDDALKAMGYTDGPRSFLESQKCFSFTGDLVKITQAAEKAVQPSAGLCPIKEDKVHGLIEVSVAVEVHVAGRSPELLERDEDDDVYMHLEASDTVARTKEIIAAAEQMPFPDRELQLGGKKLEDGQSLGETGVKNGANLVLVVRASEAALAAQLGELLRDRKALSPSELSLHYCQRFGTPVGQALRTLGLHSNLGRFLEGHAQFSVAGGCVTLVDGPKLTVPLSKEEQEARAMQTLDNILDLISETSFLSINDVRKGHGNDGEVQALIFVNGLPPAPKVQTTILKGLRQAVASSLESMTDIEPSIKNASIVGDVVQVQVEDSQKVSLRLAAATSCFQ